MVARPLVAMSPGNWLEMQIYRPHPTPTEFKTQDDGPTTGLLTSSLGHSDGS